MKTIMLPACFFLCLISLFVQATPPRDQAQYRKVMELTLRKLDSAKTKDQFLSGATQFERIAQAETTEWLPAYWAGYAYMQAAARETDNTAKDRLLDKADSHVELGLQRNKANDELLVLRAMSAQLRLPIDPMNRWMKYGAIIGSSLKEARQINPGNPRIDLLFGQNVFFTPEQYGGGPKKALPHFQSAQQKLKSFVPASKIAPNWGTGEITYFLEKCAS